MFSGLKRRIGAMRTVTELCEGAERFALSDGQQQPGSEHFLLAALDLPDGLARKAFLRIGVDADHIRPAIAQQYAQALTSIGIDSTVSCAVASDTNPEQRRHFPPAGRASAIELLRRLSSNDLGLPNVTDLSGAVVVASIASEQHSVAARALRAMNIDLNRLREAAITEIQSGAV